jgi:hypothetical protein
MSSTSASNQWIRFAADTGAVRDLDPGLSGERPAGDVAGRRPAGRVSRTTASFVMTGRRDMRISPATEQRVLQAARELNYRPNMLAGSLLTNKTSTRGLLSDRITSETSAGGVIRGAMTTALLHDHLLFLGETGGDRRVETQLIHGMIDRGVSGFLIASMYTQHVRIPIELRTHPTVLVNCIGRTPGVPMVVPDELEAGRTAVRVLLRHGHRDRIVLAGETPPQVIAAAERRTGIDQALAANGLRLAGTIPARWWPEPAHQAVRDYLVCRLPAIGVDLPERPGRDGRLPGRPGSWAVHPGRSLGGLFRRLRRRPVAATRLDQHRHPTPGTRSPRCRTTPRPAPNRRAAPNTHASA